MSLQCGFDVEMIRIRCRNDNIVTMSNPYRNDNDNDNESISSRHRIFIESSSYIRHRYDEVTFNLTMSYRHRYDID